MSSTDWIPQYHRKRIEKSFASTPASLHLRRLLNENADLQYEEKKQNYNYIRSFTCDVNDAIASESLRLSSETRKTEGIRSQPEVLIVHYDTEGANKMHVRLQINLFVLRTNHSQEVCYQCDTFKCACLRIICFELRSRLFVLVLNKRFRSKFWFKKLIQESQTCVN